jgi:hypothetical protein
LIGQGSTCPKDLRLFDVDLERRQVTPEWRAFLAYDIERNRALYSFADTGIAMLPPRSARCVGTPRMLYSQILIRSSAAVMTSSPIEREYPNLAYGCDLGTHDGDRCPDARDASGGLSAKDHDRCHSGHGLARCRNSQSRPDVSGFRSHGHRNLGKPHGLDLVAGQAGGASRRRCEGSIAESGGWFVAGASGDVGRGESVVRTIAGAKWSSGATQPAALLRARAPAPTLGRCWTSAR